MPIQLQNDELQVQIAPELGAGILALHARRDQAWVPLMPDAREPDTGLRWACFLMVPYSNRIADGRFQFRGQSYQLGRAAEHAIHGDVRHRAWTVTACGPSSLTCRLDLAQASDRNWPWPLAAEAGYHLAGRTLTCTLAVTNLARQPAPAGLGWHPYFRRWLSRPGEPLWLRAGAGLAYPDAHGTRLPSGPPAPVTPPQDFRVTRRLEPDQALDTCYAGYDGHARMAWPESGLALALESDAACSHLVIYNPQDRPFFAVEPVTHANNGANLLAAGAPLGALQVLAPGGTLTARWSVRVEHAA